MTHHHTDRDHRDIATLALHRSLAERHDMIAIGHFSLLAAAAGGQQEERSEEHTSELQSLMRISYAVFCLKKNTNTGARIHTTKPTTTTRKHNTHSHATKIHTNARIPTH